MYMEFLVPFMFTEITICACFTRWKFGFVTCIIQGVRSRTVLSTLTKETVDMKKIPKSVIFTILLLIGIAVSCNMPVATVQTETETPTITAPSAVAFTRTAAPVETFTPIGPTFTPVILTAAATPQLAPLCGADTVVSPAQCQVSVAEVGGTFCADKRPFNLIFINKGATYQSLTKGFRCSDNGVKDGKQIVACTGNMASDFKVNICDPACVVPTVQAVTTQCPEEYNYNNLLGCCTQEFVPYQPNCVTLELKTISCVVDCSVYIKAKTCNQNSIACTWDSLHRVCLPR